MGKFHASLKSDLKAIYKYIWTIINVSIWGDPEKIIELPKESLLERLPEDPDFRLYMCDDDNMFVMIVPQINTEVLVNKVFRIIHECCSIRDEEKAKDLKDIAGSAKEIKQNVKNGIVELKDTFNIFVFSDNLLVSHVEVDAATAVLIALAVGHLNSYDHIRDTDDLSAISAEALNELKDEGYD